jgi:hypothetical protein
MEGERKEQIKFYKATAVPALTYSYETWMVAANRGKNINSSNEIS